MDENTPKTDRLLKARVMLSLRVPYLSTALMRLPFVVVSKDLIGTMATDGYHIYYSQDFVDRISDAELRGCIAHELLHVVFRHTDRRGSRERVVWNYACDLAINLLLDSFGFKLPKGALLHKHYEGKSAEEIYERLQRKTITFEVSLSADDDLNSPGSFSCSISDDLLDSNHPLTKALSEAMGGKTPDQEQIRQIVTAIQKELIKDLKKAGKLAGDMLEDIVVASVLQVDWREALRSWLTANMRSDWRMMPPAKKYAWQGIYLPSVGAPSPEHLIVAIDTSGSMTKKELGMIFAEVASFRETFPSKLTIIEADADIQHISTYDEYEELPDAERFTIHGGGGTDFRPVFEWVEKNGSDSFILVYATDGYGTFPEKAPAFPTLWLATPDSASQESFPDWGTFSKLNQA